MTMLYLLSTNGGECGAFYLAGNSMSYLLYLFIIIALIYWVESPSIALSNLLIMRKRPPEELEEWLKRFHWSSKGELREKMKLPVYKFYTEVIEILLGLARKMGGNYQESLLFLREGLQIDRQFEKKLKEAILGVWFQMGLMMVLTWAFIFGAISLVEIKLDIGALMMIFFWQLLGLGFLPVTLRFLRKKYFGEIGKLWKILFILRSLAKVPLSRSEVFTLARVKELNTITSKTLEAIVLKLKATCQKCLKIGGSYEDEVQFLMGELRFQEKWHFELFEKRLVMIKLFLLSVFFLPSYLAFIFLLLGDLMALM